MALRVGTVSYLNSAPLNEGLDENPDIELIRDVPSALADALAAGRLDVGLIPSFELLRHGDYRIVPGASISCFGPVLTVKLFCRKPLAEVETVELDPSSRTSAALTRILLEGTRGLKPTFRHGKPGEPIDDEGADAVLRIGDPVLRGGDDCVEEIDLGEAWHKATGLLFVFAVWAVRPEVASPELAQTFIEAKRRGVKNIPEIARRESVARGLPEELCRHYLTERICYDLDQGRLAGLKWFATLAAEHGLIDQPPPDIDNLIIR